MGYQYYYEQFHRPYLTASRPANYEIVVKYNWNGSPANDYTLKIYSIESGKIISEKTGEGKMVHMDGQEPSGFTISEYRSDH